MIEISDKKTIEALIQSFEAQEGIQRRSSFAALPIDGGLLSIEFTEEGLELVFDGKSVMVIDEHEQDCCENVYADWSYLKDFIDAAALNFSQFHTLEFCGVPEMGILLRFVGETQSNSFFTPCYNQQNGYYSSNLALSIGGVKYDVSDFVKEELM